MKKIIVGLLMSVFCLSLHSGEVRVGFAVRDVTPKAEDIKDGVWLHGWGLSGPAHEVQKGDSLYVRAMVMRDKNETLLVVLTADTCKFHPGDVYILQEWFEQKFKTCRWHLMMNASHTHQAPVSYLFSTRHPYLQIYNKILMDGVKAVITEAVENAVTPTVVKFANLQISEDIVFNKNQRLADRDPRFGKVDTDMPVFVFSDAESDKITGFLWSVAAHPTYLGLGGLHSRKENGPPISSHAPGAVARALKRAYGENVTAMFAQGAGGDTKMQFPELAGKIKRTRFPDEETETSGAVHGHVWQSGKREGELLTQEEYLGALDNYAMLHVDIIKQGFEEGKFKKVENIELKIAGKEPKIPVIGRYPRRPEGSVADYQKIIDDKDAPDIERNRAYEAIHQIYDDEHAAYTLFMSTVVFNDELRLVTMGGEVVSEIGFNVKEYYKKRGVTTAFFGYTPTGGYYPSNLHRDCKTYQTRNMSHAPEDFDFDKFALDNITSLIPE